MKKIIPLIIAFFLVVSTNICYAKEPIKFTSDFFKMIDSGNISGAYNQLFKGSQVEARKPKAIDLLKKQTSNNLPLFGKRVGLEKVREEKIGTSVVRLVYILKMEHAPVVWEFYFYKPKDTWFLSTINFNDKFQLLHKME